MNNCLQLELIVLSSCHILFLILKGDICYVRLNPKSYFCKLLIMDEKWFMNFGLPIYIKEVFFFFFLHTYSKVRNKKNLLGVGGDPLVRLINWCPFSFSVVVIGFYNDASVQPGNNKKQVEKCRGELAKALGQ